ncbi:MAG: TFIIB-type zinc ribbon-containing protein [Gemmobacter sp.]
MMCPQCRVDLVMSDRQGIEIDYCPKCRGVWLDRGELDKIIERSLGPAAPQAAPQRAAAPPPAYQQDYRNDDGHGHGSSSHGGGYGSHGNRRRKSWLGEIFD